MAGEISQSKEKLTLARIKKAGKTFEISVDPDKALLYKKGESDLRETVLADQVFSDAKRGQIASSAELKTLFLESLELSLTSNQPFILN